MKKILMLAVILPVCKFMAAGQEMFPVKQLTPDEVMEAFPSWSPDGKKIGFGSSRSGRGDIWIMDVKIKDLWKSLDGG